MVHMCNKVFFPFYIQHKSNFISFSVAYLQKLFRRLNKMGNDSGNWILSFALISPRFFSLVSFYSSLGERRKVFSSGETVGQVLDVKAHFRAIQL